MHAITGCDTTSKVVKRKKIIKEWIKDARRPLCYTGKNEINENMKAKEVILLQCITFDNFDGFDKLCFNMYP